MNDLVAKEGDGEGAESNNDDASPSRNITVDGIDELSADDGVDRGPSNTGNDVKYGN